MIIVAVTACPIGTAHTYMAADKLLETGLALGHKIKVETQGAMGIENPLSMQDINNADMTIFAVDVEIEGPQRFSGVPLIRVSTREAIADPRGVLAKACSAVAHGRVSC